MQSGSSMVSFASRWVDSLRLFGLGVDRSRSFPLFQLFRHYIHVIEELFRKLHHVLRVFFVHIAQGVTGRMGSGIANHTNFMREFLKRRGNNPLCGDFINLFNKPLFFCSTKVNSTRLNGPPAHCHYCLERSDRITPLDFTIVFCNSRI